MDSDSVHVPVMPREVLHYLQLAEGMTVIDGTVGAGGHSRKIADKIGTDGRLLAFDRDPMMLNFARRTLQDFNVDFHHGSYVQAAEVLEDRQLEAVDRLVLDLGLSSDQLADRDRGFGFDAGGPLDMRFNPEQGRSAADLLLEDSAEELVRIFRDFGEEPFAEQIAQEVISRRGRKPLRTTGDLEDCVRTAVPGKAQQGSRNPATRIFQALRIAVNQELEHVQRMMTDILPRVLKPEGIAVILTFHSLEDRIVKQTFKGQKQWTALTPKPIEATPAEIRLNPRSRSAKLRAARRNR
ncbi:MAG: 16S rRNA (cytosine(1402)-N(4))-methyltransferase RsmH [Fuerstiella sp.]